MTPIFKRIPQADTATTVEYQSATMAFKPDLYITEQL